MHNNSLTARQAMRDGERAARSQRSRGCAAHAVHPLRPNGLMGGAMVRRAYRQRSLVEVLLPDADKLWSGRGLARYPVGSPWLYPPFPASCPYRFAVSPSPAPASSNGANGFPVRRFPVRFASRVMGPIDWERYRAEATYCTR